jgi:sulfide:quinone oxidoreductase
MSTHISILIIGGGTGGIMLASRLLRQNHQLNVGIIEPSETHFYQPAWTLVGAGTYDYEKTKRPMKDYIPKGANWIKDKATAILPKEKTVETATSGSFTYDYLVVAPGLAYDYDLVPGLKEGFDKGNVVNVYTDPKQAWSAISSFKGGTALCTQPTTPIKCGGAPQKIMYLAEGHFKKTGIKKDTKVVYATNGGVIFGIQPIKDTLMKVVDRKGIHLKFGHNLVKIDAEKNIAWYRLGDNQSEYNPVELPLEKEGDLVGIPYDLLHTAPPSVAPAFLSSSGLLNEGGWLEVDIHSLQHKRYPEIFGLGDVAALPTAKTGAAIRKQVPVVMDNLLKMMHGDAPDNKGYNGYSSCPLITEYGKMVLAEFDYEGNFTPDPKLKRMLIFDSSKEHWRLWMFKKYGLPYLYWNYMLKGKDV